MIPQLPEEAPADEDPAAYAYGRVRVGPRAQYAHRVAFVAFVRDLARGEYVLHTCDNPRCCNPEHLRAGSQQENMREMIERGRGKRRFPEKVPF